jgi:hypothetical protein
MGYTPNPLSLMLYNKPNPAGDISTVIKLESGTGRRKRSRSSPSSGNRRLVAIPAAIVQTHLANATGKTVHLRKVRG